MTGHRMLRRCRRFSAADAFVAVLVVLLFAAPELARQVAHGVSAGDGIYAKAAAAGIVRVEANGTARIPSPKDRLVVGEIKGPVGGIAEPAPHSLSLDHAVLDPDKSQRRTHVLGCGPRAPPFLA